MNFDPSVSITIYYGDKERPVSFEQVTAITEGTDGSLKLKCDSQVIKILPSYRYYVLDLDGESDDGEGEFS